jgi:hypothetical protein
MRSSARTCWLAVVATVVALAVPALAQADEVTKWNRIATTTLVGFPGPGGGAPPALQINMGMIQGAVSDAVNAIERRHRPLILTKKFPWRASKEAAVATAAYRVLSNLVLDERAGIPSAAKTAFLQTLEAERTSSLAAIPNGSSKTEGIAAGDAAADAMIAARTGDGRFGPSAWLPNSDPGHWQPQINPLTLLPILDPTPWVGNVEPFLIKSQSQFRTAGPQALTSAAWAQEFNEVMTLGAINSAVRTPLQTQIAFFWQSAGGPALLWNDVARQLAEDVANHLNIVDTARLFGLMNLAGADAAISCWNDKYYWDFWRPWNAIPRAGEDGNSGTAADPTWAALFTAPYPEHPSGHLCLDGALLGALEMFFGAGDIGFNVTSSRAATLPLLPNPRHFSRFAEPLAEIIEARIWAGLHYRTADVQAAQLGQEVVRWGAIHYFQPLR